MVLGWIEKNPFASLLTINNDMPVLADENIGIAQKWFEDELTIIGLHSFNPTLIGVFKNDKEINQFASELFKAIDLGVDEVKVETENFEDWVNTHDVAVCQWIRFVKCVPGFCQKLLILEIPGNQCGGWGTEDKPDDVPSVWREWLFKRYGYSSTVRWYRPIVVSCASIV
mgnify:CR=1 FL=1